MTDTVFLHQIRLMCHIGVTDAERAVAQEVLIDVDLATGFAEAARTDDMTHAVDYREAWETVRDRVTAHEFNLVETLADQIAQDLLSRFATVSSVTVQAVKPRAMAARGVASTGVRITRQRA